MIAYEADLEQPGRLRKNGRPDSSSKRGSLKDRQLEPEPRPLAGVALPSCPGTAATAPSEPILSQPGIKSAATEIIKATCIATGAQAGVLVLFNMDTLDPSFSSAPRPSGVVRFLAEVAPRCECGCADAFPYALPGDNRGTDHSTSPIEVAQSIARAGRSISIPLTNDDVDLGVIWLASKKWSSHSVGAVLARLEPIASIISRNICLLTTTTRQQHETRALYETSRDISAQLDLNHVLTAIVERALELLKADAAHLTLLDHDTEELCVAVPVGIETPQYKHFRLKMNSGLIGRAVSEHRTLYSNDFLHDDTFCHIADENIRNEGIRAMMCAPMFIRDKPLGAIVVCNRGPRPFTDEDSDLISSLANSAAIALENARLYEEERGAVSKLKDLNALIDSQYTSLRRSVSIHDELTQVVLDGDGVDGIVRTLSRIVGNPVIFEDIVFNLISVSPSYRKDGCSSGATSDGPQQSALRALLDQPEIRQQVALAVQQRRPIRTPPVPKHGLHVPRIVAPVVLNGEIVAHLSVLEVVRSLEELDFAAIKHGATVLALEMAKRQATAEMEIRLRGDLVHDLLTSATADGEALRHRAEFLGLDGNRTHRVLVVRIDNFSDYARDLKSNKACIVRIKTQLFEKVKKTVLRAAPQSIVADRSDGLVVILSSGLDTHISTQSEVVQLANRIREEVKRELRGVSVCIGIGAPSIRLAELRRSFVEASRSLDILERMGKHDQAVCFDELGAYRIIFRGDDQNEPLRFANDMIGKLMDYDQRHGACLVDTLEAYLANACHLKNTAARIFVHLNTLRYRLEKVEDIAGVDLSDAETRLNLQLAIKISRALTPQA